MNQTEMARLAGMAQALRPDWPAQSVLTFLAEHCALRAYRDCAVALAWLATDDQTHTPKRLIENGPWWTVTAPQRTTQGPPPFVRPTPLTLAEKERALRAAQAAKQSLRRTG